VDEYVITSIMELVNFTRQEFDINDDFEAFVPEAIALWGKDFLTEDDYIFHQLPYLMVSLWD